MKVHNLQQQELNAKFEDVGILIDTLASEEDRLWPIGDWPAMRFDKPLQPGAEGGHGPIRYTIKTYNPGKCILFEFSKPQGFIGFHGFSISQNSKGTPVLTHLLDMKTSGFAALTWPLVYKPLHEALILDAFIKAQKSLGLEPNVRIWSLRVRTLRRILKKRK